MTDIYNVYCDESCHLERDKIPVMILGAVWCKKEHTRNISKDIREIKMQHHLLSREEMRRNNPKPFEVKWTKVSPSKLEFYTDIVDFFFENQQIHFRALIIDKTFLNHSAFDQSHDDWYYKMMYQLLEPIVEFGGEYHVYLDIKDTQSECMRAKLEKVLHNKYDPQGGKTIGRIQQIRSHESELMQISDILLGAVGFYNRRKWGDLKDIKSNVSQAKEFIIKRIRERSGKNLDESTEREEPKFNLFRWVPKETSQ